MLALFENAQGYICIEDNKPECIEKLRELVKNIPRMEVKELMTKYPQGGERTLIYATTCRKLIPPCFRLMWGVWWTTWIRYARYTGR